MIRLVTLGEFPSEVLEHVSRRLHAAYGMGCEIEGQAELPDGALGDDQESYDAPKLLELTWGGQDIRCELEPLAGGGTRLTLWHNIDRRYISMGAAGWHVCFDVLDRHLAGQPIGRIVGPDAMKVDGWQRLHAEYAKQLGVEPPSN